MPSGTFIFIVPETDYAVHMVFVQSLIIELHEIGVRNYDGAVFTAANLAAEGLIAFELCAGFGINSVMQIQAVVGTALVGVVRFAAHLGLNNKSGDEFYNSNALRDTGELF